MVKRDRGTGKHLYLPSERHFFSMEVPVAATVSANSSLSSVSDGAWGVMGPSDLRSSTSLQNATRPAQQDKIAVSVYKFMRLADARAVHRPTH